MLVRNRELERLNNELDKAEPLSEESNKRPNSNSEAKGEHEIKDLFNVSHRKMEFLQIAKQMQNKQDGGGVSTSKAFPYMKFY